VNLLRRLSKLQREVLEGVARGRERYAPALGYRCLCDGKGLSLRPGELHYAWGRRLKALKSLEQRGLVVQARGVLVASPEAAKAVNRGRAASP
jgi:hypothetical protein